MENFYRSLKYLKPYRARIIVAIACVVIIAGLWGGGIGMLLPGTKVLLAPEGLHGWMYGMVCQDRLDATLSRQETSKKLQESLHVGEDVVGVLAAKKHKPAATAGIKPSDLIVAAGTGLSQNAVEQTEPPQYKAIVRGLANAPDNQPVTLGVLDYASQSIKNVQVSLPPANWKYSLIRDLANLIPEPKSKEDNFPLFVGLLLIAFVLTVVRNILTYIQEYLVGTAIWRGVMDIRCENYNVVLHMPTTFFSEKGTSDSMSRFIQDTNELARGQNTLLGKTMVEPAKAVACLIMAMVLSWKLTLVAAVAGPPAFWMIRMIGKSMHRAAKRSLESLSTMLAVLDETLTGIRVVKAYTMEGAERKRFFRVNRQLLKQQNKMERLDSATGPAVETLGVIAALFAAGGAGYVVFKGSTFGITMDIGDFLTWIGLLFALFDPVRKLAKVSTKFQQAEAAARRIFELQDTPQEKYVLNAPLLPRHSREIEFRNISFRYPSANEDALRHVSLKITAGQTVAIVGPNGCGKTTLVSLLPRLIDPTGGKILIDGHDISQHSIRSLRRQIGLVTQDSVLFHATIGENISYGLHRPRQEAVLEAARKAFVDEFVCELPQGYNTMVGEHGATLSGGQKQRISIARAILRDPAILIFDEALSQIDPDSEYRIGIAMKEFIKGRTTLMIAHRFSTVVNADMIVVMAGGAIIDTGRHDELLERCELYQHLYQNQLVKA